MAARRPALDVISHSPDQTRRFGYRLGRLARPGDVFLVAGTLGAGKTTLIQGIARGLGVEGYVQSPTFTLAMEHAGRTAEGEPIRLYHLDLYRLEQPEDLLTFGYDEYLDEPAAVVAIEWPQRLRGELPDDYLEIDLGHVADAKRRIALVPHGARYAELVEAFRGEVFGGRGGSSPAGN